MRVGLIGSTGSSFQTLVKLNEYGFDIAGVWGYEPPSTKNVSGYVYLGDFCHKNGIKYYPFVHVNDESTKKTILSSGIDLLFVVGLSQLVDKDIIASAPLGCVGFHPTKLPRGRGRAPMAWLVLREKVGAATFFNIQEGADSGQIYVQEVFDVDTNDDATSIGQKLHLCIDKALDKWLPQVKNGVVGGYTQDERQATYYARRAPLDGCIDWYRGSREIDKLIKASTRPHPGAFTFYGNYKVVIWKSVLWDEGFPEGVVGRVVDMKDNNPVVQTGDGWLEIKDYEMQDANELAVDTRVVIGSRLGYYDQYEIFKLRNEIIEINNKLNALLK